MPALAAPLLGFVLGVGFAWAAGEELTRAPGSPGTRGFALAVTFGLIVLGPVAAYFLAYNPDWCFAYFVDSQRLPGGTDMGLVLLEAASAPLGYTVAARRAGERRLGALLQLAAPPAAAAVLMLMVVFPRLAVEATYAQYHGGFGTRAVAGSRLGFSLIWMSAMLVLGTTWTIYALRRLSTGVRRD